MKCYILMFPGDTLKIYIHINQQQGDKAMPMTLGNELFQHTAFFRKFAILVGLRQDAWLKEELCFQSKGQNRTHMMNCTL